MGGNATKLCPHDLKDLRDQTQLREEEIKKFHQEFVKEHPTGKMIREELIEVYKDVFPDGDPTSFAEQMFRVYDTDKSGDIDFREFMTGICLLANGTPEQKLRIIFQMYDFDNSGYIERWEFQAMASALYKAIDPIQGNESSNYENYVNSSRMFDRLDKDPNGKVTFEEFREAARVDPQIKALLG